MAVEDVTKDFCKYPNCRNHRCSRGKRGLLSPITQAGGEVHRRSKWCLWHRKGRGKAMRVAYMATLAGQKTIAEQMK